MMAASMKALAVAVLLASIASPTPARAQTEQADPVVLLSEARRNFDALDYDKTVLALDRCIAILEGRPAQDPLRRHLGEAYEMRARARFGLGDAVGARADFVALLKADPGYGLVGQVSPRVVALFNDAMKLTVTTIRFAVTPPTAEVRLDGALVAASGTLPIAIGDHVLAAKQLGYRAVTQPLKAIADTPSDVTLALERVSAVLYIVTVPPEVEVVVDGISHGKTTAGPPPADFAELAARAGVPASSLSSVMVIAEVPPGSHVVEFKRDCHVRTERRLNVDKPDDYTLDPVKLEPAVSTLAIRANQPNAMVFVDGQQRGAAPLTIADLCEGPHVIELRAPAGRYVKRLDTHTGDQVDLAGTVRPAFALVATSGQATGLNTDLRATAERLFESSQSVTVFAPPADQLDQTLKAQQLPAGWLAFDGSKRPLGVAADIGVPLRKELSARLAKTFDAQGVASVTVPSNLDRSRIVVALLAAGSAEPDVLEINLGNPESIAAAIARLDQPPAFFRPSIGLVTIDVVDLTGAVVVGVDTTSPAAKAGVQIGDVLQKANGQAVADTAALAALLAGHKANDDLTLDLQDRAGVAKRVDLKIFMTPRLISLADQTLLVNRTLLDLRARLLAQGDPFEESVIRLNLAAALARVDNWADARLELQRVKLPDGLGVSNGTVQYLLGLCAEKLGNRTEADAAWRAAAASESLLTEDGPAIKELAEAKIADVLRRGGR